LEELLSGQRAIDRRDDALSDPTTAMAPNA
jgi:hypothetical protein